MAAAADDGDAGLSEPPLPPVIVRGLGDRAYDRRKAAALEIEALVRALQENSDQDRICAIIALLGQKFANSQNANHRKGGLIGLAACAIGLMSDIDRYLDALLQPVLHCFDDPEARVRYYSCESLYNIAKVARVSILQYFNRVFEGLCKLFADTDVDVKNGANLLDRLVKDIVTESETFDVESFIPLLQKYIRRTNPYIRQLLVGWITVLDSVPDINMLEWLPEFLEGLFNMLSDGNREIRQAADSVLAEFLREIKTADIVEFGPMITILVSQCTSKERFNRLTAITWVNEFITLGGSRLLNFFAEMLRAIMHCISDAEPEIRQVAERTNVDLLALVHDTAEQFALPPLLKTLTTELLSDHVPTRLASLRWINMLLEKSPGVMVQFIGELLPALLRTLSDEADEVVLMNLQVLARISLDQTQFVRVLNALVQLFMADRRLLEMRGSLVIRKFCVLLDPRSIYERLAGVLHEKADLDFVSMMVQTLNLILLTAPELRELRESLTNTFSDAGTERDQELFTTLFRCWCHNPVATFSLCLLAQAYDMSSCLIERFATVDVTVGFLMQVDKLVQLLESPIFIRLRLQLLEVDEPLSPHLLKSLYGLLMLLPQSTAYRTLNDRLATVTALHSQIGISKAISEASAKNRAFGSKAAEATAQRGGGSRNIDYAELLAHFETVQQQHSEFRLQALQAKSLLSQPGMPNLQGSAQTTTSTSPPAGGGVDEAASSAGGPAASGAAVATTTGSTPVSADSSGAATSTPVVARQAGGEQPAGARS